jgi:hypothetical protein
MLDRAECYVALGNFRAAGRLVAAARALILRNAMTDVRASGAVRRLERLERAVEPAPALPNTARTLQPGPSASVHTVPIGLPTLGKRR